MQSQNKQTKNPVLPLHTQPLTASRPAAQLCPRCSPCRSSASPNTELMQLGTDRAGSAWDGANLLHSSRYGATLWIRD